MLAISRDQTKTKSTENLRETLVVVKDELACLFQAWDYCGYPPEIFGMAVLLRSTADSR